MYVGPIEVDLEKIKSFVVQIPQNAHVLELGGASGTYSVSIRKRTENLIVLEPDTSLVKCIIANSEINQVDIKLCNAWTTERKIVLMGGELKESDGCHHPDDEIRNVKFAEFHKHVGFDFTHIVVHRPDFLIQFTIDYPEIVASCTVLKSYAC